MDMTPDLLAPAEATASAGAKRVRLDIRMACAIMVTGALIDAVHRLVAIGS
ncbi:MAG: hypothetical protein M3Q98_04420 [Actinomycetota bacterium]|nr:hypothetical protein [Actinomycetota bacterium]